MAASLQGQVQELGGDRVGSIDSLRCLAMTAVIAQHCQLLPFGWTGVWLFFVISGYVVTLAAIGRDPDLPPTQRLIAFFRRRCQRIVPIYYAYILGGIIVSVVAGGSLDILAIGSLLGFLNNLAMAIGRGELDSWPVGHLWTISVEMQFYVVYGLALFLIPRRVLVAFLLLALLLSPVLRALASRELAAHGWGDEQAAYAIYSGSLLHTDSFAMGALLAFARRKGVLGSVAWPLAIGGSVLLMLYSGFYVYLNYAVVGARNLDMFRNVISGILWGQYRQVFLYSALAIAAGGLVALAATGSRTLTWLLRYRLLHRIGEISYGAYIYHSLAISVAWRLLATIADMTADSIPISSRIALFILTYAMTILAAELSYRYFEARFLRTAKATTPELLAVRVS